MGREPMKRLCGVPGHAEFRTIYVDEAACIALSPQRSARSQSPRGGQWPAHGSPAVVPSPAGQATALPPAESACFALPVDRPRKHWLSCALCVEDGLSLIQCLIGMIISLTRRCGEQVSADGGVGVLGVY